MRKSIGERMMCEPKAATTSERKPLRGDSSGDTYQPNLQLALGTLSFTVCFAAWGLISAFAPRFREAFHLIRDTDGLPFSECSPFRQAATSLLSVALVNRMINRYTPCGAARQRPESPIIERNCGLTQESSYCSLKAPPLFSCAQSTLTRFSRSVPTEDSASG